jgi:hypothetical protein
MLPHEQFEELCALAVSGQLREEELADLEEHLQNCAECRTLSRALEESYFLLSMAEDAGDTTDIPEGMTQRFVDRARAAGIPLGIQPGATGDNGRMARPRAVIKRSALLSWASIVALALVAVSFFLGMRYQAARHPQSPTPAITLQNTQPSGASQVNHESAQLKEQLRHAREELAAASAKLKEREAEKDSLVAQIAASKQSNSEVRERESKQGARLEELEAQLQNLQGRENAARIASLASEAEVKTLRERVAKLSTQLDMSKELDATLREAYDLIVDRNVHVMNVLPEVTQNARSSRPRGRIFYAEGKKLVFYAYDLTEKVNGEPAFYLWGQSPDTVQRVVSLGKFQVDSEQQGRWVLKVTDPSLLANINSVFVTEEPYKKAVTQPSGRRMLFRVLDTRASDE